MKKDKNPRFFCDSCGKAVPTGASACPHCASPFSGVRCPSCGYQGMETEFSAGCPSCGFLAPEVGAGAEPGLYERRAEKKPEKKGFRLPDWFFRIALVILLMAIGGLVFLFGTRVF